MDPMICPILSFAVFLFSSGFRRQGSKNIVFGEKKMTQKLDLATGSTADAKIRELIYCRWDCQFQNWKFIVLGKTWQLILVGSMAVQLEFQFFFELVGV